MPRRTALLLVLASLASSPATALGDPAEPLQSPKPSLQVTIDRSRVDLVNHKLEVKLSRPASKVRIKVLGESDAVLAEVETPFDGAPAGTALVMTWTPASTEAVGRIEVYGYDTGGYWAGIAITPWNATIDHEEVNFETDSDVIRPSEVPKLDASLQQVKDLLAKRAKYGDTSKITLFIEGHTDTVGSPDHNLTLSRKRARAIAAWFKGKGLSNAVAWEGVGTAGLAVKTADQVDEPRNRRVVYLLAYDPPKLPGGELSWKGL